VFGISPSSRFSRGRTRRRKSRVKGINVSQRRRSDNGKLSEKEKRYQHTHIKFLRDLVDADVNRRAYASLPALVNQARGYETCNKLALRNSLLSTRSRGADRRKRRDLCRCANFKRGLRAFPANVVLRLIDHGLVCLTSQVNFFALTATHVGARVHSTTLTLHSFQTLQKLPNKNYSKRSIFLLTQRNHKCSLTG
jgi:hypothetical protein